MVAFQRTLLRGDIVFGFTWQLGGLPTPLLARIDMHSWLLHLPFHSLGRLQARVAGLTAKIAIGRLPRFLALKACHDSDELA